MHLELLNGATESLSSSRRLGRRGFAGSGGGREGQHHLPAARQQRATGSRASAGQANLRPSFGISDGFEQRLAGELKELVEALLPGNADAGGDAMRTADIDIDDNRDPSARGEGQRRAGSQPACCAAGTDQGEAETIGDVRRYGSTAFVAVGLGDHEVMLNADSKRRAVATYLDHLPAPSSIRTCRGE